MEVIVSETYTAKPKELMKMWEEKVNSQIYLKQDDFKMFSKYPDGRDIKLIVKHKLNPEKDVLFSKRIFGKSLAVQSLWNGEKYILPYMLIYTHNRILTKNFGYPSAKAGGISLWIGGKSPFGKPVLEKITPPSKPENVLVKFVWQEKEDIITITNVDYGAYYPFFLLYKILVKNDFQNLYKKLSPKIQEFLFYRNAGCVLSVFLPEGYLHSPLIIERTPPFIEMSGIEKNVAVGNPAFVIGAFGHTPKGAEQNCYNYLRKVFLPNCYFRTDIGQAWFNTKYPCYDE